MIDIERLKVDADYWDEVAPDGATHYNTLSKQWFAVFDRVKAMRFDGEMWSPVKDCSVTLNFGGSEVIKRPQPSTASLLTDAQAEARMGEPIVIESASIQQANIDGGLAVSDVVLRKASQSPYPHYFKDVSGVDAIDLYHVAKLYEINDPALFHAFKKIACAGKRGAKDQAQDVQEAIDALKRWQELNK